MGQRVAKQLWLANSGNEEAALAQDLLDMRATFCLLNMLRPVKPHGQAKLLLSFSPQVSSKRQIDNAT